MLRLKSLVHSLLPLVGKQRRVWPTLEQNGPLISGGITMGDPREVPALDPTTAERIEAARAEVRRAVASDTVSLIHPFDMSFLLKNPMTIDAILINLFERQFVVVDGVVYEQTNTVKNVHKLREMMAPVKSDDETA